MQYQRLLGEVQAAGRKSRDRDRFDSWTKANFGGLDILVPNAAVSPALCTVLETTEEMWDKIFNVNLKATFLLMKESLPFLKCSKSPSITIVTSVAAYQPIDIVGAYSVSKTALTGLCKATAEDLACDRIRVNCVAPGVVKTKFSKAVTFLQSYI
ncbi:dehydrogenase/reductase SDR family member 4-like [Harpegnathos saltator]|uniref:dehydrogenase/reductase SDR family member 4-like n=1 Tax=Harpegnathos saltator TaxID=610380 RepID=UPI000DBEE21E|nr:dehydrogenase/reductase SDR family member 4-like [Harpegnathos saltator]